MVNNIVQQKKIAQKKITERQEQEEESKYSSAGDEIKVSELGRKLRLLLKIIEKEGSEEDLTGFHYIMKEFIKKPDSFAILNFVEVLLTLHKKRWDYFNEVLFQAYILAKDDLNPGLWLGILTRLGVEEAENFIYCTSRIFRQQNRKGVIKELVQYLERVRVIINQYGEEERDRRVKQILQAGQ